MALTPSYKFTVLTPTYRRPDDLLRCLRALAVQTRQADEIIVTVRSDDAETRAALSAYDGEVGSAIRRPRIVLVAEPGAVHAMNAGLQSATGDLIALTDDDAAPHADWLARLEKTFASDSQIGGVGGRDRIFVEGAQYEGDVRRDAVGQVQWFGRVAGNHHVGYGAARSVEFLKGVNSAYRAEPLKRIGFDVRCAGSGTHIHWEMALGYALMRSGWRLVYDPEIVVDHYPAARFDEDHRQEFNALAQRNRVYNETLFLLEALPPARRALYLSWAVMVGAANEPGLLQVARLALTRRPPHLLARFRATLRGRAHGLRAALSAPKRRGAKQNTASAAQQKGRPSPLDNKTL